MKKRNEINLENQSPDRQIKQKLTVKVTNPLSEKQKEERAKKITEDINYIFSNNVEENIDEKIKN